NFGKSGKVGLSVTARKSGENLIDGHRRYSVDKPDMRYNPVAYLRSVKTARMRANLKSVMFLVGRKIHPLITVVPAFSVSSGKIRNEGTEGTSVTTLL